MGQKVHPYGFRLGIIREPKSKWFAEGKRFRAQLVEDLQARKLIAQRHHNAAISDVFIERTADSTTITIESAKPGIIIGRGGSDVDRLRQGLDKIMSGNVRVNVEETKNPDANAQLIAEEVAGQIEKRASIRRAMGQGIDRATRAGVEGIRVAVSGRLGGAEIARTERVGPVGRVPLHTLRADVDLGRAEARTTYGHIGVKVWVCKGEILPPRKEVQVSPAEAEEPVPEAETVEGAGEAVAETEAPAEAVTVEPIEAPVIEPALEAAPEAGPEAVEEETQQVAPEPAVAEPEMAETDADTDMVAEQLSVEAVEAPAEPAEPGAEEPQAHEVADGEQPAQEDTGNADA